MVAARCNPIQGTIAAYRDTPWTKPSADEEVGRLVRDNRHAGVCKVYYDYLKYNKGEAHLVQPPRLMSIFSSFV